MTFLLIRVIRALIQVNRAITVVRVIRVTRVFSVNQSY